MSTPRALVVGAGFGGIAAALRLRAKGYEVRLVDRAARLGGRAQVFERDGFRHDAGPTVITAPFLFDELFELFDRSPAKRSGNGIHTRPIPSPQTTRQGRHQSWFFAPMSRFRSDRRGSHSCAYVRGYGQ